MKAITLLHYRGILSIH